MKFTKEMVWLTTIYSNYFSYMTEQTHINMYSVVSDFRLIGDIFKNTS